MIKSLLIFSLIVSLISPTGFHEIGTSDNETLKAMILNQGETATIFLEETMPICIDSLIITTDQWRIALAKSNYTDELIFTANTAETTVLKKDLVKKFEIRYNGKGKLFEPIDPSYIKQKLTLE